MYLSTAIDTDGTVYVPVNYADENVYGLVKGTSPTPEDLATNWEKAPIDNGYVYYPKTTEVEHDNFKSINILDEGISKGIVTASGNEDTLLLVAGDNITLTPNPTNK